jgi:hypothetical protein
LFEVLNLINLTGCISLRGNYPSVSAIDGQGFYVEKSEEGLIPFSWMAFAKVDTENSSPSSNEYSNSFISMLESAELEALTKQSPEPIEPLSNEFHDAMEDESAPWEGGIFPPEDALESAEKPQPNSVANATNSPTPETLLPAEDEKSLILRVRGK